MRCVSATVSAMLRPGYVPCKLSQNDRHDRAARPGGRAELEASGDPLAFRQLVEKLLLRGQHALGVPVEAHSASVGSTRRPERSSSCAPRRFSSARICRLTAGCVTPSRSAACEALLLDHGAKGRKLTRIHKHDYAATPV